MRGIIKAYTEVSVNVLVLVVAAIAAVLWLVRPFLRMTGRNRLGFMLILGATAIVVIGLNQIPAVRHLPDFGP